MSTGYPHPEFGNPLAGGRPQPPAEPIELELAPPALDPLTADVLEKLDHPPPPRTWIKGLVLLGVTIAFFVMTGIFNNPPADIALLVGVLLLHESGHYLGMRMFNYQDVRMFFIPLFGAAVAGKR